MTFRPLLGLSAMCAACSVALIVFQNFETALLAAVGGCVLYWAAERLRVRDLDDRD